MQYTANRFLENSNASSTIANAALEVRTDAIRLIAMQQLPM